MDVFKLTTAFLSISLNIEVFPCARIQFLSIEKCFSSDNATFVFYDCSFDSKGLNISYQFMGKGKLNSVVSVQPWRNIDSKICVKKISITASMKVQLEILLKRDGMFKKLVKTPRIEWCKFIQKSERVLSGFALCAFQILKASVPALTKECPQKQRVDAVHITIPSHLISFLPQTQFKFHLNGYIPTPLTNFSLQLTGDVLN